MDAAQLHLYERRGMKWPGKAAGYLNVNYIPRNHLAPPGTNAMDTITALRPTGVLRKVREVAGEGGVRPAGRVAGQFAGQVGARGRLLAGSPAEL